MLLLFDSHQHRIINSGSVNLREFRNEILSSLPKWCRCFCALTIFSHFVCSSTLQSIRSSNMADVELRAFEAVLDTMMDQLSEESTEVIIEPPRYAHAVLVFASGDEPGELLTVKFFFIPFLQFSMVQFCIHFIFIVQKCMTFLFTLLITHCHITGNCAWKTLMLFRVFLIQRTFTSIRNYIVHVSFFPIR